MTRHNKQWILEGITPAYFAPVMGVAGLGIAWRISSSQLGTPTIVGESLVLLSFIIFLVVSILMTGKTIFYPASIKSEFLEDAKLVFFPLIPTSGLLLSIGARPYSEDMATVLWMMSAPFNLYFAVLLTGRWLFNAHARHSISPAWLFPIVGNGVVPIAGVPLGFIEISWMFFSVGIVLWIVVFAALFQRLVFDAFVPAKLAPSLLIILSPPATFFIAGYALNSGKIDVLSYALIYTSLFLFGVFLLNWRRLVLVPASITLWSLTFPLAALTIANLLFYEAFGQLWQWWMASFLLGLTTLSVSYVFIATGTALVRYASDRSVS
ncbi:MAG: SLAC1 anion channel family protein [Rhodobacteraceae bacterium]|nr:SLAC1 anion channel family protein [Paracoccaceae bacterium]